MKKIVLWLIFILILAFILWISVPYFQNTNMGILDPKGLIAFKQRRLLFISTLLMLIVVIPVFVLMLYFLWKYRVNNPKKTKYTPDHDYSLLAESIWWGLPFIIIIILGTITWFSTHELDPFRPITNGKKPLTIQVVALEWKWLFIYPEQGIATVNFIQFPVDTPLVFDITADAPMNSFWIPQLGGQIYAMPGMKSRLHLIANDMGKYRGSSANLSGNGFAGMTFIAEASDASHFNKWVESVRHSPRGLNEEEYDKLVRPSENNPVTYYVLQDNNLYDSIIMKYMMPMKDHKKD